MAAYATLVSLMHIINNLELHPHPPISLDKNQVDRLSQKITFLQNFLEGYNPSLGYSTEADPLESRIVDAAHAAEDAIESHIVDKIIGPKTINMNLDMLFADLHDVAEEKFISSDVLYDALEKLIQEMALIEKEAMEIKHHTVGVQFQHKLHSESTSSDSLGSSSSSSLVAQRNKMVGGDELLLEMKDRLKSDRLALQIIPIVGMGGSGQLPLLEKLVLDVVKFEQGHWKTIEGQFRSLKFLHIIGCRTLELWTSESSHFPRLEHLVLSRLPYFQEIPLDFADIATLRVIEVKECADSVVVSAKRITEEREEIYGEEENLQVEVTIVWKDQALLSLATPNFRVTSLNNKGRFGSIFG